jgi:hypothetical protein
MTFIGAAAALHVHEIWAAQACSKLLTIRGSCITSSGTASAAKRQQQGAIARTSSWIRAPDRH